MRRRRPLLRTMRARLVRSRPAPPRVPAQTRAPGHTGMNSNSECASFVWYLRRPVPLARSGGRAMAAVDGRRGPSVRTAAPAPVRAAVRVHSVPCAPAQRRRTRADVSGKTRRARRAGAAARTPRSRASAARRVSGAPRRDELVRCDVRARERGGRRPNAGTGVLTATEYSRVGKRVARTREYSRAGKDWGGQQQKGARRI
jgi:hypothetical protein